MRGWREGEQEEGGGGGERGERGEGRERTIANNVRVFFQRGPRIRDHFSHEALFLCHQHLLERFVAAEVEPRSGRRTQARENRCRGTRGQKRAKRRAGNDVTKLAARDRKKRVITL